MFGVFRIGMLRQAGEDEAGVAVEEEVGHLLVALAFVDFGLSHC